MLKHVRVIQGDGINPASIRAILERITGAGSAADNVAFGMGGALLQQLNRDTQKFALKCSAARVDGHWLDVFKDPITDKGKTSKRGRLTLLQHREYGSYRTVPVLAGSGVAGRVGSRWASTTRWYGVGERPPDPRLDPGGDPRAQRVRAGLVVVRSAKLPTEPAREGELTSDETLDPRVFVEVPFDELDDATLVALIESFVGREGTDYGLVERTLAEKIADVRRQLERGDARIVFDPETEEVNILPIR